jgi:P4 family phage/plasmid primase-like protien
MNGQNLNPLVGLQILQQQQQMTSTLQNLNDHPLGKFLELRRCGTDEATLTGMETKKGKFKVTDEEYPKFLDMLHDYLFVKSFSPMNLIEQPRDNASKPLLFDLDFKYPPIMNLERKFNLNHIRGFVDSIVNGLKTFFDLSPYEELRFFICLRPGPYRGGQKNKDGIHIQCPDITLVNEKWRVLRNWLYHNNAIQDAFDGTGYDDDKDEKVIDASLGRKLGWFFYGESKPTINPYKLEALFTYNVANDELEDSPISDFTPRELLEIFSIRYNIDDDDNEVRDDAMELYNAMKIRKGGQSTPHTGPVKTQTMNDIPDIQAQMGSTVVEPSMDVIVRSINQSIRGDYSPDDIPLIRRLVLECLSEKRADDYSQWMEVGWCLHNISSTDDMFDKMFQLWMEFSKKSPKWTENNEGNLRRAWERMDRPITSRPLKWRSLHYWAKQDNPTAYADIIDEDLIEFIARSCMSTHFHIAQIMKIMFSHRFKASIDSKKTEWFMFDNHVWKHINQGMELRGKISTEVVSKIEKARARIRQQYRDAEGTGLTDTGVKRMNELLKVEKSLYTQGFKESVMKECAGLFYEEEFLNKLNVNSYLLACNNGVLNLRAERMGANGKKETYVEFRPGLPEDYLSFMAGREAEQSGPIDYKPYDPNDPNQAELDEFLSMIFPRPELKRYMITLLASCLEGNNSEQCYYTLIGVGGNGKSKIVELMRMVLGDYQSSLAPTALTRKRPDSGAANPDIMSIKNRRFIYLQEPDDREPLNTSRMKQFTGEDIVEARGLFSDQDKFIIKGKLFMLCNSLPPIHQMDRGTWRRIRVINFESLFVDQNDAKYGDLLAGKPKVFPKDKNLNLKLKKWREAFFSLLVHTYQNVYCVEGLIEPEIVKMAGNAYKERFDSFEGFLRGRARTNKQFSFLASERTDFKIIYQAYRNWFEYQGGTGKRLTQEDLKKRCEDAFGPAENNKYFCGVKIFNDEVEVEEFEKENS